jgi:magnesium-transporting ATPase (P-type)
VSLTSLNDWVKDKQFVRLQSSVKDENIAVIRGKHGATQSVDIYDLVAGDIILLETGSRIPADALLIEGTDITVDEKRYSNGADAPVVRKTVATPDNLDSYPDPFLLSETLIASGSGKAVVCCVGEKSRRGVVSPKLDTTTKTPLQRKLENLGANFTKWGLYGAIAILVANVVNFIIRFSAIADYKNKTTSEIINEIVEMLTLSITIIIVAVPEGLPLAITLSLAYSVMRMKDDGVLVRNLESPEVMGRVDEIVTGKTATLTSNDMKVDSFYAQSLLIRNTRKNTLFNCELFPNVIDLIQESIVYNCEARIEMDDKAFYNPVGNGTEVGFLRFLQDAEIPVHDIIKKKYGKIEAVVPFSSSRKRSVTAINHPDNEGLVRVFVKGAPEIVVAKCTRTFDIDGKQIPLLDGQINYILNDILIQKFTTVGFRTIAFAYKDFPVEEFQNMKEQYNNFATEEDRTILETQLTFLGLFALFDPLRQKVSRAV